jgi:Xaa-Pro aminopeptidase
MQPDLADLDTHLADHDCDAYLVKAASDDSDQRYLSGFDAPDDFVTCYTDGDVHLLVSGLEYGRATTESHADPDDVARYADYDYRAKVEEHGPTDAFPHVLREFLADLAVDAAAVPGDFPVALADELRDAGLTLTPDTDGVVTDIRAVKTDAEVEHVHAAQKANEAAMRTAETMIADATVDDGVLHHDGDALTSERVKEAIEITLLRHGCSLDETIVACGSDGADPHNRGSGPLHADQPIVVDIFPRDKDTKYHADMTRTFCKGTPTDEQQRRYDVTEEAFHAAMAEVEPGTPASDVHAAVCDVYEDHGYPTLRSDEGTETGFIHSTGHGVGLDVHEGPAISDGTDDELQPGHVITIEPGLYHPDHGGVRIEDLVVVTEDGYRNLTDYPISFTPESRQ